MLNVLDRVGDRDRGVDLSPSADLNHAILVHSVDPFDGESPVQLYAFDDDVRHVLTEMESLGEGVGFANSGGLVFVDESVEKVLSR